MDETDVADVAEGPVEIAAAAPDRSPVPAPRPETEQASAADAAAESTELAEVSLEDGPEPVARLETPNSPLQFEHSAEAVAEVAVQEGEIAIPGLPPIAFDLTGASDATPTPGVEPVTDLQPVEMIASLPPAPMLARPKGRWRSAMTGASCGVTRNC